MHERFLWKSQKGIHHYENLDVVERIILKWMGWNGLD
jgi:hypothetical protein